VKHASGGTDLDEAKARAYVESLAGKPLPERAAEMAARYVEGNDAYEDDPAAKEAIVEYNRRVYGLHDSNDRQGDFAQVYWTCREWSYDYFKLFYEQIGVEPFEKFYPESETAPAGVAAVQEQLKKGVYRESDGAVVFRGEPYGLHTRVFINSQGLPTYEGKDVGLILRKWADYSFDMSVVITGNDIVEYMKVVLKSVEQFEPELVKRSRHLTHGQVKLEGGVKMSSRKGNILYADDILGAAEAAARKVAERGAAETANAAVKYALLKQRLGGDIIYNPAESVAVEGNSGPYLQYAHARARSILGKAGTAPDADIPAADLQPGERTLVRKMSEYAETVDKAVVELMPHYICTYLYELAQTFNRFYENNRVIGDERQQLRLVLVQKYADTLKNGLTLLGIASPDKM
jgi:arginyl-tRNA synthetase